MMIALRGFILVLTLSLWPHAGNAADPTEKRFGLVIGNGGYAAGSLPTAANDAGLIAQTLQAAGFDVMGARDLDGDALRHTFRDFVDKVAAAGSDAVVFVYLSGHGLQFEGENFLVPVDARIERDLDVPVHAIRISDYTRPLGALKTKAVVVVLDLARPNPFAKSGQPLAGGLALVEPTPGMMVAFNAAPGTIAPEGEPPYGVYAKALAEMIRDGGLPLGAVFDRVRLRVNDLSRGASAPWHANQVQAPFVFFERAPDAPAYESSVQVAETRRARPIRDFDAREAYLAALERDTLQGYLEFLDTYPGDPLAKRVRAIVAARREAITWRRTRSIDTPEAYWSYLDRYPRGPHAWDARRRLAFLTAPPEPPRFYSAIDYDLPPPPREEIVFLERPVLAFYDPVFLFAPPPPPPVFFLPPPPPPFFFVAPPPPIALFVLPVPVFVAVPVWVRPPPYVTPPPNNVIFNNIHNTTIINNTTVNQTTITTGQPQAAGPTAAGAPPNAAGRFAGPSAVAVGAGLAAAAAVGAAAVALPPSLAAKAATSPPAGQPKVGLPVSAPGASSPTTALPGNTSPLGKAAPTGLSAPASAATVSAPSGLPSSKQLPGAPSGPPLPLVPGKSGPAATSPQPQVPAQSAPLRSTTVAPSGPPAATAPAAGTPQGTSVVPVGRAASPPAPVQSRAAAIAAPQSTPPSASRPDGNRSSPPPPAATTAKASPASPRQTRLEQAAGDRARIEQQLQQDRQRQMEIHRQQAAAQDRLREQQQQAAQQRRLQEQQAAQQRQQQQQAVQQRQPPPTPPRPPAAPPPAQNQKKCGVPGSPPCR